MPLDFNPALDWYSWFLSPKPETLNLSSINLYLINLFVQSHCSNLAQLDPGSVSQ